MLCSWLFNPARIQAATGLTATNGSSALGTNAWTNPANAHGTTDDNVYATAAPGNNSRVAGVWTTYGFDSNLPTHAVITKVEILSQYRVNTTASVANLEVQAVVSGTNCPVAALIHSAEPTTDTVFTADVTSCRTWTRADLLNANFRTRVTAHRGASLLNPVTFSMDYVQARVTYNTPDYEQAAYRWYDNADSLSVGTPLANQNTVPTLYAPKDRIRLRFLLHVTTATLLTGSEQFKLQFAAKGATCNGLTYNDVTAGSLIAFYNNPTPASGAALSSGATDPTHSGHTVINQAYYEASPFSTLSNVTAGQDGIWDVALVGNGADASTNYCLRVVKNDGSALTTYTVYPELVTSPAATLAADIVDASGNSVASPSFGFSALVSVFACNAATATLGTSTQRIRLKNTTDTPGWNLTIAATGGSTALWSAGTPQYDFNDSAGSPAGCSAGLDSDVYGGQMTLDPSVGTIAGRAVSMCNTTGVSKGASAAFVEGLVNAITLMSASASATTGCYWELTDVGASQRVPAGQNPGSYSINLTLTAVAN